MVASPPTPVHLVKDRMSFRRDGLALSLAIVGFLGIPAMIAFIKYDPTMLGWSNSATIFFTALTVGGLIFPRWRSDIEKRAQTEISQLQNTADLRAAATASWWRTSLGLVGPGTLNAAETQRTHELHALVAHNNGLLERAELITFAAFMFAVVSGGVSIGCELRQIFGV